MSSLSDSRIKSSTAAACSIVSCLSVLTLSAWVWTIPSARNCLDRLSFRLLLHALSFEIIYDIAYLVVVVPGITGRQPYGVCATGVYFMMAGMGVVNYLVCSIAVNLALTIVLGLNPLRLKLERWYVGASVFIGMFVPIIPGALGHFGWDPVLDVCWIRADTDRERIRNMVLDLYLWQLLSCAIAIAAVIPTLVALFRQGRATSRALVSTDSMNLTMLTHDSEDDPNGKAPVKRGFIQRMLHRRRQSRENARTFGHLEDRFVRIAVRIAAYPIALIIVNGVITIGDLYISSTGGVKTEAEYGLYVVYYFLYGARGCVFVTLCLFVDPCLRNGLRQAWAVKFPKKESSEENWTLENGFAGPLPTTPGLRAPFASTLDPNEKVDLEQGAPGPTGGNMDFMTALFALDDEPEDHMVTKEWNRKGGDEESVAERKTPWRPRVFGRRKQSGRPTPASQAASSSRRTSNNVSGAASPGAPDYSDAFTGVPLGAMPVELGDGAEDVVQREVLDHAKAVEKLERALAAPSGSALNSISGPSGIKAIDHLQLVDKLSRRVERVERVELVGTPNLQHSAVPTPRESRDGESFRWDGRRPSVMSGSGRGDFRRPSVTSNGRTRSRTSDLVIRSPRTIEEERRQRRDRAFELAERLYEELEAQL